MLSTAAHEGFPSRRLPNNCSAVAAQYRPAVAHCLLLFLCTSSGLFAASTALLPSTFTMYCLTAAAAALLEGRPYLVIGAAAIGEAGVWRVVAPPRLGRSKGRPCGPSPRVLARPPL